MKQKDKSRYLRFFSNAMLICCAIATIACVSCGMYSIYQRNTYAKTTAVVEDVFENSTRITYPTESRTVTVTLSETRSTWLPGSEIQIYYNKEHPTTATTAIGGFIVAIITGVNAILFLVLGLYFHRAGYASIKKRTTLMKEGTMVHAWITNFEYDTNIVVNDEHPVHFLCADQNGTEYMSENTWIQNPETLIGQHVNVYVKPNDSSSYYVDDAELQERLNG